jgi:D-alanyl-D-alanine carboxypeptidase/D-alanyl-D-alanine-endopeptidase (penicillin-binding protein 4)
LCLLILANVLGSAGGSLADDDADVAALSSIGQLGFANDDVGYVLLDLQTNRVVAAHNADRTFVPGSVIKLATSLVAWRSLGADFHFTTRLWQQGDSLYLQGTGDPVLTATDLQRLARQVQMHQPMQTWRQFVFDAAAVLPSSLISDQQPAAADYNAGFGALNVDFNRLAIDWSAAAADKTQLDFRVSSIADEVTVPVDWLRLAPTTTVLPPGAPFILADPGSVAMPEAWQYDPDLTKAGLAVPGRIFLPVKQTDLATALIFRRLARDLGIALPQPRSGAVPGHAVMLAAQDSPSLPDLLRGLLRYSNNISAELIGLATANKLTSKISGLTDAAAAHVQWLTTHLSATDWHSFKMVNHSGLDGDNRATPRQIASLLQAIAADPQLAACLPVLQITTAGDLQPTAELAGGSALPASARPQITGKSGTMNYAAGLAGLITVPAGRQYAYVVFIVDERQRAALLARFDPRILKPDETTRRWTRQARLLEARLLQHWLSLLQR